MAAHRAFYVTQGSLAVWEDGGPIRTVRAMCLRTTMLDCASSMCIWRRASDQTSFIVIDVIEEEFAPDTIPKLGLSRPRCTDAPTHATQVSANRLSPAGVSGAGIRKSLKKRTSCTAQSRTTNCWIRGCKCFVGHEVPLTGIYLGTADGAAVAESSFNKTTGPVMLLTQHQDQKLRQVFMQDGHVKSAQAVPVAIAITDDQYPQFVLTEIGRSRRYLERTRLAQRSWSSSTCISLRTRRSLSASCPKQGATVLSRFTSSNRKLPPNESACVLRLSLIDWKHCISRCLAVAGRDTATPSRARRVSGRCAGCATQLSVPRSPLPPCARLVRPVSEQWLAPAEPLDRHRATVGPTDRDISTRE